MVTVCRTPSSELCLREIHEGSCSMHAGTRFVLAKALSNGYYWPTMLKDARSLIRVCQDCQVHKPVPRNPQQKLAQITSPWPFYKWGIDIAEPFPEWPGRVKFLIVAMDYFTKWIETKPVATITGNQIKKFVWGNIVCRFGLPRKIILDNRKQFRDNPFKGWCEKLCIRQHFASVKHPQTNGLVKRANRSLREGIKVSHAEDTGKLGPKWEGPYEVMEALGKGAYKLRDREGKQLPLVPSRYVIFDLEHSSLSFDFGFAAALAVLITGASQSRQHSTSESDNYYLSD
ncbi:reverse transcriptase domain-containing protein [Tanacetum coccineum]